MTCHLRRWTRSHDPAAYVLSGAGGLSTRGGRPEVARGWKPDQRRAGAWGAGRAGVAAAAAAAEVERRKGGTRRGNQTIIRVKELEGIFGEASLSDSILSGLKYNLN